MVSSWSCRNSRLLLVDVPVPHTLLTCPPPNNNNNNNMFYTMLSISNFSSCLSGECTKRTVPTNGVHYRINVLVSATAL